MQEPSIIELIKKKKEYSALEDSFLKQFVDAAIKQNKSQAVIVKEVRAKLREIYGAFKKAGAVKILRLIAQISSLQDVEMHTKILKLHASTKERIPYYSEIYKWIFHGKKIETLLDLGCGLNPLSSPWMPQHPKYIAVELTQADADLINKYFSKCNLNGEAHAQDIASNFNFPKADICFMLKLLDTLESIKHNVTKELLDAIDAKYIVVSFSTKSLGGKKSISKKRLVWFERLIQKYSYDTFEVPNEFFYLIQKS